MMEKPGPEHAWLEKFVGEWTMEGEGFMGPDQPPMKFSGTESGRSIGGMWVQLEGKGVSPGGTPTTSIMTLGYSTAKKQYVGTWIGSMMSHLWQYTATLEEGGKALPLKSEGPVMEPGQEGKTAMYTDRITWENDDHRVLTSTMVGADGKEVTFMTAHYRRVK